MATSVLVSLIVLISFYGFQVDGKVERYAFNIVENGTSFNEQIDVDVENQTEVIRVPKHNNLDAMEQMIDFNAGLSVRRIPATRDCYLSKLDSSFPSLEKMKADLDLASRQSLPDEVTTTRTGWKVVSFADRLTVPKKIRDFCGTFPIYNVEPIVLDSINVSLHRFSGHGRRKRHHVEIEIDMCSGPERKKYNDCLVKHGTDYSKISVRCRFETVSCYYKATCKHKKKTGIVQYAANWRCQGVHEVNYTGVCCRVLSC